MKKLTVGKFIYSVPSNVVDVPSISVIAAGITWGIERLGDYERFDVKAYTTSEFPRQYKFCIHRNQITFFPAPKKAYRVRAVAYSVGTL